MILQEKNNNFLFVTHQQVFIPNVTFVLCYVFSESQAYKRHDQNV